jgi:hypothetical protein
MQLTTEYAFRDPALTRARGIAWWPPSETRSGEAADDETESTARRPCARQAMRLSLHAAISYPSRWRRITAAVIVLRIGMMVALLGSGVAVWWASKRPRPTKDKTWRDDSLDAWRLEQDARRTAERDGTASLDAVDSPPPPSAPTAPGTRPSAVRNSGPVRRRR